MRKLPIFVHHPFGLWNAPQWFAERLQQEFLDVSVVHLPDYKRVDAEIQDAEIVITWSVRPEQIKVAKKLRIHSPAAAVHQLIFPEISRIAQSGKQRWERNGKGMASAVP